MGEIAESMLSGEMCACCGVWLDGFLAGDEPVGFAQYCESCAPDYPVEFAHKSPVKKRRKKNIRCDCGKHFASDYALEMHRSAKGCG